jgi:hypothetical protein
MTGTCGSRVPRMGEVPTVPTTIRQGEQDDDLGDQSERVPLAHPPVESSTGEASSDDLDLATLTALHDEWNSAEDAAAFYGLRVGLLLARGDAGRMPKPGGRDRSSPSRRSRADRPVKR